VRGVPHLKDLNEKFRLRGFEIVAVSDEPVNTIDNFVKQHSIEYGIVRATGVLQLYGGRGYPSAWALDAEGKVIWKGHPNSVNDAMVEEWIKDLAPLKVDRELDRALRNAVRAFDSGDYGRALSDARQAAERSDDEKVKADAAYLESLVQKHIDLNKAKYEKSKEGGDLIALSKALQEALAKFKGSEHGDKADEELKELNRSKEFKDTVKAHEELEKIKPQLDDMRPANAKRALERIASRYPDTAAGKEAAELARRYE
jgi:hypothetical protein